MVMISTNKKDLLPYIGALILALLFCVVQFNSVDLISFLKMETLIILGYVGAVSDLRYMVLKNKLVLLMATIWMLLFFGSMMIDVEAAIDMLVEGLLGFLIGGAVFMLVYIVSKKGLGAGDVKFMAVAGLYVGSTYVFSVMLYGTCLAALTGLVLMALKKMGVKDALPMIPFLYMAILVVAFWM